MLEQLLYLFLFLNLWYTFTSEHYIPPPKFCLFAQTCNHTWKPICGLETNLKHNRMFLDECDMFEYNCDNQKVYYQIGTANNCSEEIVETSTNPPQTSPMEHTSLNETSQSTVKASITTEMTTTQLDTTQETASDVTTEHITNSTDSTTPKISTSESTISETNTAQTTNTTISTASDVTTENVTNSTDSTTPKISTSESTISETNTAQTTNTTISTIQTTIEESTKLSTSDSKNVSNQTKSILTSCTARPFNVTTPQNTLDTSLSSTTHTTLKSTLTVSSTPSSSHKDIPIVETTTTLSETQTFSDPCEIYQKHCDRPKTWETTLKGETRDFFQILKARFGNRFRILADTTHWPRRVTPHVNDVDDDFQFGHHNEGKEFD